MTMTNIFILYLAFIGVLAVIKSHKEITEVSNECGFGFTILMTLFGLLLGYAIGLAIVSALLWFAIKILTIIGITQIGSWTVAFSWNVVMAFVILCGVVKMLFGKIF